MRSSTESTEIEGSHIELDYMCTENHRLQSQQEADARCTNLNEHLTISELKVEESKDLQETADVTNSESNRSNFSGDDKNGTLDSMSNDEKKRGFVEKMKSVFNRDYISKQAEVIRKYTQQLVQELEEIEDEMVVNGLLPQIRYISRLYSSVVKEPVE